MDTHTPHHTHTPQHTHTHTLLTPPPWLEGEKNSRKTRGERRRSFLPDSNPQLAFTATTSGDLFQEAASADSRDGVSGGLTPDPPPPELRPPAQISSTSSGSVRPPKLDGQNKITSPLPASAADATALTDASNAAVTMETTHLCPVKMKLGP